MQDRLSVLFLLQKGGENIFYRNSTQIPDVPGTLWTQPSYLSCFFSHVINKPEPFRKRHSSLFTLHIPAVIIINRTIPNINTNSQIYYKESKEEFEIFLCGSSVNQYIDCYVLFFFKRNSSCHRLLPTFGNHIKIIERFIHFCRLGTRIVPVEQVFCVTPQKLPLTASFWLIIQMGYRSAITNIIMNAPWFFSLDRKLAGHYSFPKTYSCRYVNSTASQLITPFFIIEAVIFIRFGTRSVGIGFQFKLPLLYNLYSPFHSFPAFV